MSSLLLSLIDEDYGLNGSGRWCRSGEHDSLVVDTEKGVWYWNSRGMSGDTVEYLVRIRNLPRKEAEEIVKKNLVVSNPIIRKRKIESPPYDKLVDLFWSDGRNKREYWYSRLLDDPTIDRYRLGHHDGWNTVPLFEEGVFLNFQIRRDIPNKRIRYWYDNESFSPVLMGSDILRFVDTVYITEGIVDSMLLNQLGIPSVAQTGGNYYWNPEWYPLFSKISEIYYIADNDAAGKIHSRIVSNSLGTNRTKIVTLGDKEHYDTVDFFRAGGDVEQFKNICRSRYKYLFELESKKGRKNENRTRFRRGGV